MRASVTAGTEGHSGALDAQSGEDEALSSNIRNAEHMRSGAVGDATRFTAVP